RMRLNRMQHDASRTNLRAFTDLDIAEDLRAYADHHPAVHLGMTIAAFLAGAAKRHGLQDGHIITYEGRFADDDARAMVEHDAAADPAGGVDIDGQTFVAARLDEHSQQAFALAMQMMADTVCLQRKEPLGEQEHFQRCVERRVATDDRLRSEERP